MKPPFALKSPFDLKAALLAAPLAVLSVLVFFLGLGALIAPPAGAPETAFERLSLRWVTLAPTPEVQPSSPPLPPPPPEIMPPEPTAPPVSSAASQKSSASQSVASEPLEWEGIKSQQGNIGQEAWQEGVDWGAQALPQLSADTLTPTAATPVYREPPRYPRRALARRLEGWVELAFQVNVQGQVVPESIRVLAAEPQGVFERSAKRALARWRFAADEIGEQGAQLHQRLEFRLESAP